MMDELNKSVGSRTSLNFVDKLCDRLNQSNVVVKEEPRDFFPGDNFSRNHVNKSPLAMPVLEKEKVAAPVTSAAPPPPPAVTVTSKKPILETEVTPIAQSSFDVVQKNDKVINDMIQKLKGKLMTPSDDKLDSPITLDDTDYDSEGPPPLTHVNELVNIKPADATTKTLLIGGLVKVIKSSGSLVFSCLVPPCVYSTEDQDAFQVHCREAHRQSSCNRPSTLCETCGMEVVSNTEGLLLESLFTHAITEHGDFIHKDSEVVEAPIRPIPPTRTIRLRKLSGDALSIIKKDDDVEQNENIEENREDHKVAVASEEASVETTPTPMADEPVTMAELEMTEDNPFPFKIAGVMSLAEPQPPPLAPLAKSSLQIAPGAQLIVKEARMSKYELKKPRKTQKAMAKFIESVSDLYKCPHYYCLFSTNFRDFLERHLKAHKVDQDVMVPCVYCDMKTPWEHVPMHIDIRHAHCRYACSYCLYRAILKEYVALHQDQSHPDKNYSVIALPQPKSSKKFAIAENKADPKALCLPFKCTKVCNVEFLFESEFRRHLNDNHGKNYIHCGHEGCTVRINANLMPKHWVTHDVSSYQCGYCKFNKPVLKDLYCHLAKSHPGCNPEILIRSNPSHTGQPLGYTPDAFKMMVKVTNIPKSLEKLVTRPLSAVGGPKLDKLQTPNTSLLKPPLKTYSLLTSGAGTSSGGNYLILTSSSAANALSNIVLTPTSPLIDSTALVNTVSSVSTTAPSVQECSTIASVDTVVSASPLEEIALIQADQTKGAEETSVRRSEPTDNSQENQLSIDPIMEPEHIDVGDDHHSSGEDADPTDVDPLSLDTDLGEASKAAEGLSSDEECDESKVEKSKKAKIGLLSYQLYRCAFCEESFSNSNDFKRHVHKSLLCRKEDNPAKPFMCVHCRKKMKSAHVLAEHIQCHGILRFSCSLCSNKYPTPGQARSHAKARHNITQTTLTPLRPHKTNIDIDEYVVRPRLVLQPPPPTEAVSSEPATSAAPQDNVYMPDETDKLPMRHILSASVKCGLCSYMTKVRTNMVRHLQFHSQEKAVSESAPVNPVPCLEKNEKMFDKMVNLASSSHSTSRMSGAKGDGKEKEAENLPEFVLSHCRYVCPAQGCNYLCPEEANLRHHILALHDNETSFTCCHCKLVLTQTDADSLLKHLKLHGLQLHKCQYCSFMHNLKHKVEKHVADNHLDLPVKVITVRCLESEPNDEEPSTSAPSTVQLKVHKPWRCCMCKYKSGTQEAIQQHVLEKHEVDAQFKCTLCTFKNNDKDSLAAHFKDAHNNQTIDMIYTYRKMEEDKEKESETFDTTPLWQRDRPRVRHIRGILFEESSPVVSKSPKKVTKNAPTPGPAASKTATPAPGPSVPRNVNLDSSIESVVNGTADILKGALSKAISDADLDDAAGKPAEDSNEQTEQQNADDDMDVIVIEDDEDKDGVASSGKNKEAMKTPKSRPTKRKAAEAAAITKLPKMSEEVIDLESTNSDSDQDEFSERNLRLRYGGYGLPLSKQLKCPACNQFKSKRIADFIFHLYKEMKVYRFKCKICADESITFRYMYRHVLEHKVTDFDEHITFLPPDPRLEAWIQIVIREQSLVILQNFSPAPDSNVNGSVPCNFCGRMYRSEQEKNEHTIIHWSIKPFGCAMCKFTCYNAQEVEKHLEQTHKIDNAASQFVCAKAPTVVKELKLSDDSHLKEANSKFYKEAPEAETVPEEDPLMLPDDVSADPPVEAAAADVTATSSDRFSELVSDQKEEDDELRDLVIVTKTDSNVPKESDVFCCEYCPFMTNSETYVISHITSVHEHMHIKFKTLNKLACETSIKDYVACTVCNEAGSEIRIRQHYMEEHEGQTFLMYRFICSVCGRKFLKMNGLKSHCKKMHPGSQLEYVGLNVTRREDGEQGTATPLPTSPVLVTVPAAKLEAKHLLRYKCSMCRYERDFPPNQVTNVRSHVRQHFKAYFCGVCVNSSFRTRQAAANHFAKAHAGMPENVVHNAEVIEMYNVTMAKIIIDARPATEADAKSAPVSGTRKPVARKSTAAPFKAAHGFAGAGPPKEYSYYGQAPEPVDLGKIKTVVELNGMCLNMTAEKLSKIFDLEARVEIEDCNLSVNLSTLFDS
ncbi:hypothetical protein NQ317_008236 [Molorchus minor]|uniref:C2H2-type domain-containing protein n=1 Tax=Molorchus minor TaxID=1323400 RepID=A0ABQ9J4R4_9CUCU|nr:hypothetical protein NQ317_008236 [Molorchus minor]